MKKTQKTQKTQKTRDAGDFRAILSNGGTGRRVALETWFDDPEHAEARRFVSTWVEMQRNGESTWSGAQVAKHLRANFDFPYRATSSIAHRFRELASKWTEKK